MTRPDCTPRRTTVQGASAPILCIPGLWLFAVVWIGLACPAAFAQIEPPAAQQSALPPADSAAVRYRRMLERNPVDGPALDRLWKLASANRAMLLEEYRVKATAGSGPAAAVYGHLLRRSGKPAEALEAYRRAGELSPEEPAIPLAEAEVLMSLNKPQEAAAALGRAIERLPSQDPRREAALLRSGELYLAAGRRDEALGAWERALSSRPDDTALRRRLAELCEANELLPRAIAHHLEIARNGAPDEAAAAARDLARLFERQDRIPEAISSLENGLERVAPGNWLAAGMIADLVRLHRTEGTLAALRKQWAERAAQSSGDPAAAARMAELFEALGEPDEQRRWLDRVLELQPSDRQSLRAAARLAADGGDYAGAAFYARKLLELQPGDADSAFFLAENLVRAGESRAAREVIMDLASDSGANPETTALAVQFLSRQGFWDAAESLLKTAADAAPSDMDAVRALARFYFERDRSEEGLAAVARAVDPGAPPEARLEALSANAALLAGVGFHEQAADVHKEIVALDPDARRRREYSGALASAGRTDEAAEQLRLAIKAVRPEARTALDRELFSLLSAMPRTAIQPRSIIIPGLGDVPLESHTAAERRGLHPAVAAELAARSAAARADAGDSEGLLALARWQALCGQYDEAMMSAQRASAGSEPPARALLFLVDLGVESGRYDAALEALDTLIASASGEELRQLERRRAGILASAGRFDDAVLLYRRLAENAGRDQGLLVDFAETLERAEQWAAARDVWRDAFNHGKAGEREKALKGLVRALERLGNPKEALDLLDAECQLTGAESRQRRLFIETAEFARRTGQMEEFAQRWKRRAAAGDASAVRALATLYKRSGDDRAAYEVLRGTDPRSADREGLMAQIDAAEEFGDFRTAVNLLEIALERFPGSLDLELRHARLCERGFLDAKAAAAWERILKKAPRNAAALAEAAGYRRRMGDAAGRLELLERAAALDGRNAAVQHALGIAHLEAGNSAGAANALLHVLDAVKPVGRDPREYSPPVLPRASTLESLPAIVAASRVQIGEEDLALGRTLRELARRIPGTETVGERGLRLDAVRRLSELHAAEPERGEWLARWKTDPHAPEALHAFHFSNAHDDARAAFMHWIGIDPGQDARLHWIWSAATRGDARGLADWLASLSPAEQRRFALLAHAVSVLEPGCSLDTDLLFPEGFAHAEVLWQAALLSGRHGQLETAVRLAERAETTPDGPADPITLAGWLFALDRAGDAFDLLDATAARTGSTTFDTRFSAMRAHYLALEAEDAGRFAQSRLAEAEARAAIDPAGACLVRLLMHSLLGNAREVTAAADDYARLGFASGLGGGARSPWSALLGAAVSFREWSLPLTSVALLRAALADEARIQLLDEEGRLEAEQARILLASLEIGLAAADLSPGEAAAVHGSRSAEWLQALAAHLEAADAPLEAARIYAAVFAQIPDNDALWRSAVLAYAAAGRFDEAERFFFETLAAGSNELPEPTVVRTGEELAEALENALNPGAALDIVERLLKKYPWQSQLRRMSGEISLRLGRTGEAIARLSDTIQGDASDWPARLALSEAIAAERRYVDALEPLGVIGGSSDPPPRTAPAQAQIAAAVLQIQRGRSAVVLDHRRALALNQAFPTLIEAAFESASQDGDSRTDAMAALVHAAPSSASPTDRALCTLAVARLLAADTGIPDERIAYWLREAEDSATAGGTAPAPAAYSIALRNAAFAHPAREPFREAFAGLFERQPETQESSGAISTLAAVGDAARVERIAAAVGTVFGDRTARAPIETIAALRAVDRADLAAGLSTTLAAARRDLSTAQLTHAHTLWLANDREQAQAIVRRLERLAGLEPSIDARIALFYREVGEIETAERRLREVVESDPLRRTSFRADYARILLAMNRAADAFPIVRALHNPEIAALYAISTNQQNTLRTVLDELDFDPAMEPATALAVVRLLEDGAGNSKDNENAILDFIERHPETAAHPAFPGSAVSGAIAPASGDLRHVARWAGLLERALAQSPAIQVRERLAAVYFALAAEESLETRALTYLDRAMRLAPQQPDAPLALAARFSAAGRIDDAKTVLRDFVSRSQNETEIARVKAAMPQ